LPVEVVSKLRRGLRSFLLAAFLGLAMGYAAFYSIFPLASVPADSEPSLALIITVLLVAAILAGFETREVPLGVVQAFLAVPLGVLIAAGMALSPLVTGFVEARTDEIVGFTIVLGLPIFFLSLPVNIMGLLAGIWIRDRLLRRAFISAVPPFRGRK